jgi:Protein of unknown function (DUF2838)
MATEQGEKTSVTLATLSKEQKRKLQRLSRQNEINATMGVLNMIGTVIIAVRFPAYYWIWHLFRTFLYVPARFYRFRRQRWELYLLDWCYVVTYLSTICTILALVRVTFNVATPLVRYNRELILSGFAMASGPLSWSVFVFRNSVVFHDIDHSTSVFIHLSPALLFWCFRWGSGQPSILATTFPGMFSVCSSADEYFAANECFQSLSGMVWCTACSAPLSAFLIPPALLYLCVWSVPYYLVVLVFLRDWCERTNRDTLYSYLRQAQPRLLSWFETLADPVVGKRNAGAFGYMVLHFVSMVGFCSTSYILWHSFLLHTIFLATVFAVAVHNGSTYMFRVFAFRFAQTDTEKNLDKLS